MHEIEQRAEKLAGPLKSALARVLRAKGTAYQVQDLEHGKLNRRQLWKLTQDRPGNPKVFKESIVAQNHNVAVALAINLSSSMSERVYLPGGECATRLSLAVAATLILGDVLNSLNIPFCVYGHTTSRAGRIRFGEANTNDQAKFTRFGDLVVEVIKDFDVSWSSRRHFLAALNYQVCTYDAEAVLYGVRKLASQPRVDRRILIMMDDGEPCPYEDWLRPRFVAALEKAVKDATQSGIEVVGVGIGTPSVKNTYPDHVFVEDISKLPDEMLRKFGELLGFNRKLRLVA